MTTPDAPTLLLEFTPAMRTLIEDAIEALILLLDEIDGDADLEMTACECRGSTDWSRGHHIPDDSEESWDQEFDLAEHGIADSEGLQEQWGLSVNGVRVE